MFDQILSALPIIGGLWQGSQERDLSRENTEKTIQANMELAKYAYSQQQQQIGAQNFYNSPAQQMARFKAAGLNPHLIYGQGNAGNQQSIPQFNPPHVDYSGRKVGYNAPEMLAQFMAFRTQMAQNNLIKAQTEGVKIQNALAAKDLGVRNYSMEETDATGNFKKHDWTSTQYETMRANLDRIQLENKLHGQQYEWRSEMNKALTSGQQMDNVFKRYRNNLAKIGIMPGDAMGWRALVQMLDQAGVDAQQWLIEQFK